MGGGEFRPGTVQGVKKWEAGHTRQMNFSDTKTAPDTWFLGLRQLAAHSKAEPFAVISGRKLVGLKPSQVPTVAMTHRVSYSLPPFCPPPSTHLFPVG